MSAVQDMIRRKPYLAWYVADPGELSDESVLEHVLNYGNWDDVQEYIKLKGMAETARLFGATSRKQRVNYRPEIAYYFKLYFKAHVPSSFN